MIRRILFLSLGVVAVVGLLCVYYLYDPREVALFPRCLFQTLTGLSCPGCGSQRALYSIVHLDIAEAFRQNAFLFAMMPLLAVLIVADVMKERKPLLHKMVFSRHLSFVVLVVTLLWFVLRNFFAC
ncbi:MAG: DUF2752 domain-containing protein [Marinilabiliaceae bacterium]|nr:DUF2752 domain-containing protein [Marinilabiliaceae bacterium]